MAKKAHRHPRRKQFAALPYRMMRGRVQVLFVTSRGTRQWIIPKGKPEAGKNNKALPPHEVALLEARQEAGVAGAIYPKSIGGFLYDKHTRPDRFTRTHLKVYLLQVKRELVDWKEKSQRKRQWIEIPEAVARLSANTNIPGNKNKRKKLTALFAKAEKKITRLEAARRRKIARKMKRRNNPAPA